MRPGFADGFGKICERRVVLLPVQAKPNGEMSETDDKRDYYTILGTGADASRAEIERRYKRLAVRHHPDRGGDEEKMKSINEAYRILRDDATREAYDTARRIAQPEVAFVPTASPAAQADALGGRVAGALLSLFSGLTLLFLVRFQYVLFLWPLALLGLALSIGGIWMAHAALVYARAGFAPSHPVRRFVWAQETAFWSLIGGGIYGVYLLLTAI